MIILNNIIITLLLGSACLNAHAGKIIKWVDENGVTQYGDRPPMPNKSEQYSVIKGGVTVEKVAPREDTTASDKISTEQSRYDNALLASYNSIEEIEIARKRNIKIDELTLANLETKHQKSILNLQKNNKALLAYAKKNQPAPADLVNTIEKNESEIAQLEEKISERKQLIEKTNARYEKDKKRYAELEPRKGTLGDIKYGNKNIATLKAWRAKVETRINNYESQSIVYKRRGQTVPAHIRNALLAATRELQRANDEISAAESALKSGKAAISK